MTGTTTNLPSFTFAVNIIDMGEDLTLSARRNTTSAMQGAHNTLTAPA
jgi:hypothetical protein